MQGVTEKTVRSRTPRLMALSLIKPTTQQAGGDSRLASPIDSNQPIAVVPSIKAAPQERDSGKQPANETGTESIHESLVALLCTLGKGSCIGTDDLVYQFLSQAIAGEDFLDKNRSAGL